MVSTIRMLLLALSTTTIACGGGGAKSPRKASSDGGVEAGVPKPLVTSPPAAGLPPVAVMPPAGVAGSKKASRRPDPALAACGSTTRAQGAPEARLLVVAGACGPKLKPVGAVLRGQQGDKDAHQEQTFRAEANHCYRVYVAAEESAKDLVVVLRDSAGDVVAESPGPAVPDDGTACFSTPDQVSILVGVGSGKGAWAAQVVSD